MGFAAVEGRPPLERELIERARAGDGAAYEELVRLHSEVAFRTAYLAVGRAVDAEEVAQDAFIKAYRALPRFRADLAFRPWLLRIVANEASNRRRSAGRRAHLESRLFNESITSESAPSAEEIVEAGDDRRSLLRAVNELGEEDRLVIAHRYVLELSVDETAAALGCAPGTVKSRLSRAVGRLRQKMRSDG
ncbi:MAG: RNA polymerase sigma factor [Candidatus Dormibacteraeota bacterium]|nr:RNA polymerase sigma factor [Candidatus Dormibacteraeota bacterium]